MTHIEMINAFIATRGFKSYLEIGIHWGQCFDAINCQYKIGVDPDRQYDKLTHQMTSDEFFAQNTEKFDIIFIDGLHLQEQVQKDFENAFRALNPGGVILLHDCNPPKESWQERQPMDSGWCGDVWKAWVRIMHSYPNNVSFTFSDDAGVGVFLKNEVQEQPIIKLDSLNWEILSGLRKSILKLVSPEQFRAMMNL